MTESGRYEVDPDGPEGLDPVMVLCDFETNTTEILHGLNGQENKFDISTELVLTSNIEYEISMSHIEAIINASESCEQEMKFKCFLTPLQGFGDNKNYYWKDRLGEDMYYFHSLNNTSGESCQCGKSK